jgi:hypothetical protein
MLPLLIPVIMRKLHFLEDKVHVQHVNVYLLPFVKIVPPAKSI